jgi:hypothetical protein
MARCSESRPIAHSTRSPSAPAALRCAALLSLAQGSRASAGRPEDLGARRHAAQPFPPRGSGPRTGSAGTAPSCEPSAAPAGGRATSRCRASASGDGLTMAAPPGAIRGEGVKTSDVGHRQLRVGAVGSSITRRRCRRNVGGGASRVGSGSRGVGSWEIGRWQSGLGNWELEVDPALYTTIVGWNSDG